MLNEVRLALDRELVQWQAKYECDTRVLDKQVHTSAVRGHFPLAGVSEIHESMFADVAALSSDAWFIILRVKEGRAHVTATLARAARSQSPSAAYRDLPRPPTPRWVRIAFTAAAVALACAVGQALLPHVGVNDALWNDYYARIVNYTSIVNRSFI